MLPPPGLRYCCCTVYLSTTRNAFKPLYQFYLALLSTHFFVDTLETSFHIYDVMPWAQLRSGFKPRVPLSTRTAPRCAWGTSRRSTFAPPPEYRHWVLATVCRNIQSTTPCTRPHATGLERNLTHVGSRILVCAKR